MVKKAATKSAGKKRMNVGGRPRLNPEDLRTERLVIRVHPDLMAELRELAGRNGITRSLLVERAMIAMINQQSPEDQPILGVNGRYTEKQNESDLLGTPDSFKQLWGRVIGGEPAPARPVGFPREPIPSKTPQPPRWVKPDDDDAPDDPAAGGS